MTGLTLARSASATVMGMQVYERAIDERADAALAAAVPGARLHRAVVRSLRAPLAGDRRLPMGLLHSGGPRLRREVARWAYPGDGPVHRLDLGLPPSPRGDVVTVHDVAPWRFAEEGGLPPAARAELARADAVITVSDFSAGEIAELLGVDDAVVIPNGVDVDRFAGAVPLDAPALADLGVTGLYVLCAGGASPRKNLDGLAAAWPLVRRARPDLTLVLAGPPHPRRDALFAPLEHTRRVGRVADDVLPGLLAGAAALVVPSLYEGFGLPAVEAMAAGVPVVAVRAGALPEVLGGTGVLTGPDPRELAEGVVWATSEDPEIGRLVDLARTRAQDCTWERSAARHAQVWAQVIAARS